MSITPAVCRMATATSRVAWVKAMVALTELVRVPVMEASTFLAVSAWEGTLSGQEPDHKHDDEQNPDDGPDGLIACHCLVLPK